MVSTSSTLSSGSASASSRILRTLLSCSSPLSGKGRSSYSSSLCSSSSPSCLSHTPGPRCSPLRPVPPFASACCRGPVRVGSCAALALRSSWLLTSPSHPFRFRQLPEPPPPLPYACAPLPSLPTWRINCPVLWPCPCHVAPVAVQTCQFHRCRPQMACLLLQSDLSSPLAAPHPLWWTALTSQTTFASKAPPRLVPPNRRSHTVQNTLSLGGDPVGLPSSQVMPHPRNGWPRTCARDSYEGIPSTADYC